MKKILLLLLLGTTFSLGSLQAADEETKIDPKLTETAKQTGQKMEAAQGKVDNTKKALERVASKSASKLAIDSERLAYLKSQPKSAENDKKIADLKIEIKDNLKKDDPASQKIVEDYQNAKKELNEAKNKHIAAQKELGKAQNEINRKKSKESLDKLSSQSGSFNTSEFLCVGKECDLHLDSAQADDKNLIQRILGYMISISGTFGVLMLIIGGFFMITSEGDDNRLQKGKNIFLYTLLGLVMIFVSYIIVQFVISVLFK